MNAPSAGPVSPPARIAALATEIEAVLATTSNPDEITTRVEALAKPLAADQGWVTPECYKTHDIQGIGVRILYETPGDGLFIETVCWQPGRGVAPHDHRTWGVVIGLDGTEMNTLWRRLDDGSQPGHAELEVAEVVAAGPGDVIRLMPEDIHSVRNDGDQPSLSLHIYGRDLATTGRSEFDPDNEIQRPCPQRIRDR